MKNHERKIKHYDSQFGYYYYFRKIQHVRRITHTQLLLKYALPERERQRARDIIFDLCCTTIHCNDHLLAIDTDDYFWLQKQNRFKRVENKSSTTTGISPNFLDHKQFLIGICKFG